MDPDTTEDLDKDGAIPMDLRKEVDRVSPSCEGCHLLPPFDRREMCDDWRSSG